MIKKLLSHWFEFDYDIVGEYLEHIKSNEYRKRYLKRHKVKKWGSKQWHYLPML